MIFNKSFLPEEPIKVALSTKVFTPSIPAQIAFVDRDSVNDKLVAALRTPGKQIVVYGHSGSGKTTLLNHKLEQLYEGHITSRCMKGTTIEALMREAFDQLDSYFISEKLEGRKNNSEAALEASYFGIKTQLKSTEIVDSATKKIRFLPPELTPNLLAKLMGSRRLCWVIEDFHKVETNEKTRLSQFMKIFMDCASDYSEVKIIAVGAVETARQVVEYDSEMRNRVAEIEVPLMSEEEINGIIVKGTNALNLEFPSAVQKVISQYSSGLAAVCHQLCLNMCMAANVDQTLEIRTELSIDNLEKAIAKYVEECSDTISSNFEKARKMARKTIYKHADEILEALSAYDNMGAGRIELLKRIKKKHPKYTDAMLKTQLSLLQEDSRGSLVRYSQNSGMYSFSNPVYRVFANTLFHKNGAKSIPNESEGLDLSQLVRLLEKELRNLEISRAMRLRKSNENKAI